MLERFLFIGTGGTGGTVLRHTWDQLDRWLRARGHTGGVPAGWRFLHFDLPENTDVIKGDVPGRAQSAVKYVNLASSPRLYRDYDRQLLQLLADPEPLAGWRTDPALPMPLPYDGAGQRRTVGNLVSLAGQSAIRSAITEQLVVINNESTRTEIEEISRQLQLPIPAHTPDPSVVVVSSLGGGSGSGMFLNVIEILMGMATSAPWLSQRLFTVLFTPDALKADGVAGGPSDGMEPNSLAAVSEFLSAFNHQGEVDPLDRQLFNLGGGGVLSGPRVGRYNFFVGRSNGDLGFAGPPDVAKAVGRALSVLAADDTVRGTFQSYVGSNWAGAPVMSSYRLLDSGEGGNAATALGYASVSLGRDVFARYAAERLARHALERLLEGHREHAKTSKRRDDALIAERADQAEKSFFAASGLHELGAAHNDVLERLVDRKTLGEKVNEAIAAVRDAFSEDRRDLSPDEALTEIQREFTDRKSDVVAWAEVHRFERMREWVGSVQEQLLYATADRIGRDGFAVTLELLSRLEEQARQAASELVRDAESADNRLSSTVDRLQGILGQIRRKVFTPQHEDFKSAVSDREGDLIDELERDLFRFAAVHLRDVAEHLIPPLRRAVASTESALNAAKRGSGQAIVAEWSSESVGRHLLPARNELLLEPVDDYPAELERLFTGMFTGGKKDAQSEAIREVISGAWLSTTDDEGEVPKQQLFDDPDSDWSPQSIGARTGQFGISLDLQLLYRAAERWVRNRRGGISRHVSEDIGTWLKTTDRAELEDRTRRFVALLNSAVDLAAPLVTIGDAYSEIHGADRPRSTLAISTIPIGPGTTRDGVPDLAQKRYDDVLGILSTAGLGKAAAESRLDPNAPVRSIELMTFLTESVHPAVFTSLTEPVLEAWERTTVESRREFWSFRRSRQLSSFIVVSRDRQAALARGWIVATELGYVGRLAGPWSQEPLDVWSPAGRLPFPRTLLGIEPFRQRDVLPALLESMPLAIFRIGRGVTQEAAAYARLLDLGAPSEHLESELAGWILRGEFPKAVDGGTAHSDGPDAADGAKSRAAAILERLTSARTAFHADVVELRVTEQSSLTTTRRWEFRDVFVTALDQVIERVEELAEAGSSDDREDY